MRLINQLAQRRARNRFTVGVENMHFMDAGAAFFDECPDDLFLWRDFDEFGAIGADGISANNCVAVGQTLTAASIIDEIAGQIGVAQLPHDFSGSIYFNDGITVR